MMKRIVGVLILLGTSGLLAATLQKLIHLLGLIPLEFLGLIPTSYVKFSGVSLLLAIALSAREVAFKGK